MEDNSEVEIELTLDSGLVCDFIPDFRLQQNTADHTAVSWGLSGTGTPLNVVVLCDEFYVQSPTDPTFPSGSNVRLLP